MYVFRNFRNSKTPIKPTKLSVFLCFSPIFATTFSAKLVLAIEFHLPSFDP